MKKSRNLVPKFIAPLLKKVLYDFGLVEKILEKKYDFQSKQVIELTLKKNSNWIDIGAHKGDILKELLDVAPHGTSYAFEPLPFLYKCLQTKYGKKVTVSNIALSDKQGEVEFVYFKDRPSVSGLKERKFAKDYGKETIQVKTEKLDNIIDKNIVIDLIKLDVEGAEMLVLRGGEQLIKKDRPIILFEFGIGGADLYGTTPEMLFDFMAECKMEISTLEYFVKKRDPLSKEEFAGQYLKRYNYFFIAYPLEKKLK